MAQGMYIVCVSNAREKLQMAAMMASVAAAAGEAVTVFFSMNALRYFVKGAVENAPVEGEFGALMERTDGVPAFKQLFVQAAELGDARLLPCSMAVDLMAVSGDELDPALGPPTGLMHFLNDAEGGRLLTF